MAAEPDPVVVAVQQKLAAVRSSINAARNEIVVDEEKLRKARKRLTDAQVTEAILAEWIDRVEAETYEL